MSATSAAPIILLVPFVFMRLLSGAFRLAAQKHTHRAGMLFQSASHILRNFVDVQIHVLVNNRDRRQR